MTLARRLVALARDPELRWERRALALGALIPGPLDELVIYPAVVVSLWFRRRHVLERHGIHGRHAVGLLVVTLLVATALGIGCEALWNATVG